MGVHDKRIFCLSVYLFVWIVHLRCSCTSLSVFSVFLSVLTGVHLRCSCISLSVNFLSGYDLFPCDFLANGSISLLWFEQTQRPGISLWKFDFFSTMSNGSGGLWPRGGRFCFMGLLPWFCLSVLLSVQVFVGSPSLSWSEQTPWNYLSQCQNKKNIPRPAESCDDGKFRVGPLGLNLFYGPPPLIVIFCPSVRPSVRLFVQVRCLLVLYLACELMILVDIMNFPVPMPILFFYLSGSAPLHRFCFTGLLPY
jgi:hypothetical protein